MAAGESSRFGSNKLLARINGDTVVSRVVRTCVRSKADEVIVVLGHDADRIKRALKGLTCKLVFNENYHLGMSSSVKAGLRSCFHYAQAILILPADVAFISTNAINKVIDEYLGLRRPIVIASHRERSGHPILLDRSMFPEVSKISEEGQGLKGVLRKHVSSITKVQTSREVLIDIDTKEEYGKYAPEEAFV